MNNTGTETRRSALEAILRKDGINGSLIAKMTDTEISEACSIEDYAEYNRYMLQMARKYNI